MPHPFEFEETEGPMPNPLGYSSIPGGVLRGAKSMAVPGYGLLFR